LKGILEKPEERLPVAIKTTKSCSKAQHLRAMLKEIKVMMYAGEHPNLVTLLGCVTANLREGSFCQRFHH